MAFVQVERSPRRPQWNPCRCIHVSWRSKSFWRRFEPPSAVESSASVPLTLNSPYLCEQTCTSQSSSSYSIKTSWQIFLENPVVVVSRFSNALCVCNIEVTEKGKSTAIKSYDFKWQVLISGCFAGRASPWSVWYASYNGLLVYIVRH